MLPARPDRTLSVPPEYYEIVFTVLYGIWETESVDWRDKARQKKLPATGALLFELDERLKKKAKLDTVAEQAAGESTEKGITDEDLEEGSKTEAPQAHAVLEVVISISLLAALLLSPKLWLSSRSYPLTPVVSFLKPISFPFDYATFGMMLVLLTAIVFIAKPTKSMLGFVFLAFLYALFDQSRWQPWFYQYVFMLAALNWPRSGLQTCRLIVVSVYFWSGIQKINSVFIHDVFPWMLGPLTRVIPAAAKVYPLGYIAPFIEIGIGIGLLTKKFRTPAIFAALMLHLFILVSLFLRHWDTIIWPWNAAMAFFVVALFWKRKISGRAILWKSKKLVLVMFGILPALSLFNLWDSYLSFALYSGNVSEGRILSKTLDQTEIYHWSYRELNVPPYPEARIFKQVARRLCKEDPDLKLIIQERPVLFQTRRQLVYGCSSLRKP